MYSYRGLQFDPSCKFNIDIRMRNGKIRKINMEIHITTMKHRRHVYFGVGHGSQIAFLIHFSGFLRKLEWDVDLPSLLKAMYAKPVFDKKQLLLIEQFDNPEEVVDSASRVYQDLLFILSGCPHHLVMKQLTRQCLRDVPYLDRHIASFLMIH